MVEHARIFYLEDDPDSKRLLQGQLIKACHEVVLESETFEEALQKISRIEEIGVNVVILDGNLGPWSRDCRDGILINAEIKKHHPTLTVIANSTSAEPGFGDITIRKGHLTELLEAIRNIQDTPTI